MSEVGLAAALAAGERELADEEKVLRVIALTLAVWRKQQPASDSTLEFAEMYLKFLKGERDEVADPNR